MKALPSKFTKVKTSLFGFKFVLGSAYANPAGLFFFMSPPTRKGGQERENPMRKILFVIALMSAGRVWAIAPIGPAASTLEKGQLELGFDYAHTKVDDLSVDATIKVLGLTFSEDLRSDGKVNGYWANVGYGLVDPLDIFLRLGAADLDSAGTEFAWGLGVRATVAESERLDWGVLAQMSWSGGTQEETILDPTLGPVWGRDDFDFAALQIAAGPVYKGDGVSVYGGPLLYWLWSDSHGTAIILNSGTAIDGSVDAESGLEFGGYVGLSVDLADNLAVQTEAQFAAHIQTLACSLICRF